MIAEPSIFCVPVNASKASGQGLDEPIRIISSNFSLSMFSRFNSVNVLKPGGAFVSKVFQGGAELNLLNMLNEKFETVRHAKPKASRDGSPEMYLVAKGFRGARG